MKKLFTFCFFAFALLIGTQSALAQDKAQLKEKAYLQAKEIRSMLKFNDNTLEDVYNAFYAYETKLLSAQEGQDIENSEASEEIKVLKIKLQSDIKTALGQDLYKRYLIATNQEDITN